MSIQTKKYNSLPSKENNYSLKRSLGRKSVLIGALMLMTSTFLNAQVKQIFFPKDSTKMKSGFIVYKYQKKKNNQAPAIIEFVGAFEVLIPKNPIQDLKINEDIYLCISEQKILRQENGPIFIENEKYVFFYADPLYFDGIMTSKGILSIYRKKVSIKPDESIP